MGVGSMSGLYIGISGLQTNNAALQTTAHNLSNLDTDGYSRQQILMRDTLYSTYQYGAVNTMQTGLGTDMSKVRQVRDYFADKQFRLETGRESFYESMHEVETEIEKYFGTDVDEQELQSTMNTFWQAMNELQKTPDSIVNRETFIQAAQEMVEEAKLVYNQVTTYQENVNEQINSQVKEINDIAKKIHELNREIIKIEAGGVESANDLRDERNEMLDKLATYGEIHYTEDGIGCVTVNFENNTLVAEDRVFKLGTQQLDDKNKLLTVVWEDHGNMHVYNFKTLPNATSSTDVGSLKGLLFARGDFVGNYTHMSEESIDLSQFTNRDGSQKYATVAQMYAGEGYTDYADYYSQKIAPFMVSNLEAQLDYLMHNIMTTVNDILCPNIESTAAITATDAQGNLVTIPAGTKILDTENAPIGLGDKGLPGVELFTRANQERYTTYTYTDGAGKQQTLYVYNEEDAKDTFSQYTINQVEVNDILIKNPSKMTLSNPDHSNAQDVLNRLLDAWSCEGDYVDTLKTLTPNTLTGYDFQGYYNAMISDLANIGSSYNNIAENQQMVANQLDNRRQTVAGTSSDEELSNMIMFQQAYNASSRYINVVSDMLDTLVNRLGRA